MRQWAVRYFLWNKRLLKKPGFVLILCLVPLLAAGLRAVSHEESGLLHIALYTADPQDSLARQVIEKLQEDNNVLVYHVCRTQEEAREMVRRGEAEAAWLFPEDLAQAIRSSAAGGGMKSVVTVVECWESLPLIFSREILAAALYPEFSYAVYEDYVRGDLGLEVTPEELRENYERNLIQGSFVQVTYLDGQVREDEENNYLLSPMRGFLSLWLVLCGFAAVLYRMEDERKGVFGRLGVGRRPLAALGVQAVLLLDGVILLLAACRATGIFVGLGREILAAVLFAACTGMFCTAVGLLAGDEKRLAACIPAALLGMAVFCPAFINLAHVGRVLQYLLPPYYYLKSIHSNAYLIGMVMYLPVSAIVCLLLWLWRSRRRGKRKGTGKERHILLRKGKS